MSHDYSEFAEEAPEPGSNLMTALVQKADEQEAAEAEIERLEALLEESKSNLRRIAEKEIPELMGNMEGSLKLPDERVVKVAEKIRANIKADDKPVAYKWLEDAGHGALIKREFKVDFGKDQEEISAEFEKKLREMPRVNFKKTRTVPWQAMDKFVREKLEAGEVLPPMIGVYRQFFTKIK